MPNFPCNKKQTGNIISLLFCFVVCPTLTFIISLFKAKNKNTDTVIFCYFLLFGLCFTINADTGFDSLRYVDYFEKVNLPLLLLEYNNYFSLDGSVHDIYFQTIAYAVSTISNNYHILFLLVATVFSIFFMQVLSIFRSDSQTQSSYYYTIFILVLMATNPIFNINGVRFWTASWVAVAALLLIARNYKIKGIVFLCFTPLIHSTYIIVVCLYFVWLICGKYEKFWVYCAIISYPVSSLTLKILPFVSDSLPAIYQSTLGHYTESSYIAQVNSGVGFTLVQDIFNMLISLMVLYVLFLCHKNKKYIKTEVQRRIFHLAAVYVSFVNIASSIPSLSSRFKWMVLPFILYLIWVNIQHYQFKKIALCLPLLFSFQILYVLIKQISMVIPIDFLYMNAFTLIIDRI